MEDDGLAIRWATSEGWEERIKEEPLCGLAAMRIVALALGVKGGGYAACADGVGGGVRFGCGES